MIAGLGIDLVSLPEFSSNIENSAFLKRIFTESEINYCQSFSSPLAHYAGKFAVKEAFMKAIGKGIKQEVWFSQIEVRNHASGAPYLAVQRKAKEAIEALQISKIHISISHSKEHAVAIVILESHENHSETILP